MKKSTSYRDLARLRPQGEARKQIKNRKCPWAQYFIQNMHYCKVYPKTKLTKKKNPKDREKSFSSRH